MEIILQGLAMHLKRLRKAKGLTQAEMGRLLGCTERHYQKIEYGNINVPATTLLKLADLFEVTTDYLLGRTE